jgi:hypothetical protein
MSARRARRMDPAKLPEALREFLPIFEAYGVLGGERAIAAMLETVEADPQRLAQLAEFARRYTPDKQDACDAWLARVDISRSYEAAKVYFFLVLADALTLNFAAVRLADFVEHALRELRTFDTPDARAGRMFAAQSLAERGPPVAPRAEAALREATRDEAPEVAAWAHAALALVTRTNEDAHRSSILRLIGGCAEGSIEQSYAEDALAELEKPQAVRDLARLCGACILDDVETIRAIAGRVDVNARDSNGRAPIEYAVANSHAAALELLLARGAYPNTRSAEGRPVLHEAAARRRGDRMIPLLLACGADVNARDAGGATAVAHALRARRDENARLLREHGGVT